MSNECLLHGTEPSIFLFTNGCHGIQWIWFKIKYLNWLILWHTLMEGEVMWRDSNFVFTGTNLHQIQKIGMVRPVKDGKLLKIDICKATISGKNPVICNGGYTCQTGEIAKVFKCMSYHCTKWKSPKSVSFENTYHITTMVNNWQNGHGKQGSKGLKRIKTTTKDIISNSHSLSKLTILAFMFISKINVAIQFILDIHNLISQTQSLFQVNCLERTKLKTWLVLPMLFVVIQWVAIS